MVTRTRQQAKARIEAARHVDAMTAAGYSMRLVKGSFRDGAYGISTAFPERPLAADPVLDGTMNYPRTKAATRALAAELRRRGLVINMERHEVTR